MSKCNKFDPAIPFYSSIDADFKSRFTPSWHKKNTWDFRLKNTNTPKMIGLKMRGIYGPVKIYFNRKKQEDLFQTLRAHFETLLSQNGFTQNGNILFSEKEGIKLEYDGSQSYSLVCPEKKADETNAAWQKKGLILLAQLLEKLYGVIPETKHHAQPGKHNTRSKMNTKGKDKSSRTGDNNNEGNPLNRTQTTDIDPRQWGKADEIENMKGYPVKENLQKIYEIGEYEIAYRPNFPDEGPVYYLTMKNGRPCLSTQNKHKHTLKQIVSWPMCASEKSIGSDPGKIEYSFAYNGEEKKLHFPSGGIKDPCLHPQFVFLGENWSTTGDGSELNENAEWANGYCDQAKVVRDSKLSGGYFTDFFKFFLETNLTDDDINSLASPAEFSESDFKDNNSKIITWFEVYVNILCQELNLIEQKFGKPPKYIIVWGITLYKRLNDIAKKVSKYYRKNNLNNRASKTTFSAYFPEYEIRVFGLHYANSATKLFPLDYSFPEGEKVLQSARRVYKVDEIKNSENVMYLDRNNTDLRRYDFALIEDEHGQLHAYKGNPPETSN